MATIMNWNICKMFIQYRLLILSCKNVRMTSCPLYPWWHTCYIGQDKGSWFREGKLTQKICPQLDSFVWLHWNRSEKISKIFPFHSEFGFQDLVSMQLTRCSSISASLMTHTYKSLRIIEITNSLPLVHHLSVEKLCR